MKNLFKALFAVAVVSLSVFSCQKTINQSEALDESVATQRVMRGTSVYNGENCPSGPYLVTLVSKTLIAPGQWEWKWRIQKNALWPEAVQDLSHMDLLMPACMPMEELLSAAWSVDNAAWNSVSITPVEDPSINSNPNCAPIANPPSIKLALSSDGYFKIVISENYVIGFGQQAIFKSGSNTCQGYLCFEGINCMVPPPEDPGDGCSFSQGFWFAKPMSDANAWPGGSVTMGGKVYTAMEARALWWVSGNIEIKRAFTQAATIKLSTASGYMTPNATTDMYVNNIDGVLSGLPKLTPANIVTVNKSLSAMVRKSMGQWAGALGTWVDANHCERLESSY